MTRSTTVLRVLMSKLLRHTVKAKHLNAQPPSNSQKMLAVLRARSRGEQQYDSHT